jgi:hypothetical protein
MRICVRGNSQLKILKSQSRETKIRVGREAVTFSCGHQRIGVARTRADEREGVAS